MLHKWKNCWWMQFYEKQVVGFYWKHIWMLLSCASKQSGVSIKKSSSLTYHLKMYQWPTISNWFWNKWANKTSKAILHSTLIWWHSIYIFQNEEVKKTTLCLLWMSISSRGGRKGIFTVWQITNKKYSSMLYTIYNISSNFPHVFRSLFQLVCFYPHLPWQTTITKEKDNNLRLCRNGLKTKEKSLKLRKLTQHTIFTCPFLSCSTLHRSLLQMGEEVTSSG